MYFSGAIEIGIGAEFICLSSHLVNVPVGLQIAQVANPYIGAHTFNFLVVPEREGIVIAIGKNNTIWS
jgi:hypothetical protein